MLGDLVFALRYIKKVFETYGLLDLYVNFANTLQQISQGSNEDLQKAQRDYKTRIREAHAELEPKGWSYSQLNIFDKFGARKLVGDNGLTAFLRALADNQANTPGAIDEINRLKDELTKLIANTDAVLSSLGTMAEEVTAQPGEVVLQVVFNDKVAIDNIVQQAEQIETWKEIIRAFSLLAGTSPNKARIIAVSKTNPFTEWLGLGKVVGELMTGFITECLKVRTKHLEMRKAAVILDVEELSIKGKKLQLLKECDDWARKRVVEIVEQIAKIKSIDGINEGNKNAALNELRMAGPHLYDHILNGGQVDTSKPSKEAKVFSDFQLQLKYEEVKQLETEVQKLLDSGTPKKTKKKVDKPKKPKKPTKPKSSKKTATKTENPNKEGAEPKKEESVNL